MQDSLPLQICPQVASSFSWTSLAVRMAISPGLHHYLNTKESSLQSYHNPFSSWQKKGIISNIIEWNHSWPVCHFWRTDTLCSEKGDEQDLVVPFKNPSCLRDRTYRAHSRHSGTGIKRWLFLPANIPPWSHPWYKWCAIRRPFLH